MTINIANNINSINDTDHANNEPVTTRNLEWYRRRIEYLSQFMLAERYEKLKAVLGRRTRYMTVCAESMFHPQNASALVRHCDAFGVQDIYAIEGLCKFQPNVNIVKGTDKWITLRRSPSTTEAVRALRGAGYRIIATTPHSGDSTPETFDVGRGPFALVFGTEHAGVSEEVLEVADEFIRIPMEGFVESLNVSASAAILIHILSQRVRSRAGLAWQLPEYEKTPLLFQWMTHSLKDPQRLLQRYEESLGTLKTEMPAG